MQDSQPALMKLGCFRSRAMGLIRGHQGERPVTCGTADTFLQRWMSAIMGSDPLRGEEACSRRRGLTGGGLPVVERAGAFRARERWRPHKRCGLVGSLNSVGDWLGGSRTPI